MGHWLSCIVLHLAVTRTGARSCDEHYYQMQAIADRRHNMVLLSSLLCSLFFCEMCVSVSGAVFFYARLINSLYQRLLSESFFIPAWQHHQLWVTVISPGRSDDPDANNRHPTRHGTCFRQAAQDAF